MHHAFPIHRCYLLVQLRGSGLWALGSPLINASPALRPRFPADDIQFTPGEGLPTLESLNLTAVELVEQAFRQIESESPAAPAPLSIHQATKRPARLRSRGIPLSRLCAGLRQLPPGSREQLPASSYGRIATIIGAHIFSSITIGVDAPFNTVWIEGVSPGTGYTESYCRHVGSRCPGYRRSMQVQHSSNAERNCDCL